MSEGIYSSIVFSVKVSFLTTAEMIQIQNTLLMVVSIAII